MTELAASVRQELKRQLAAAQARYEYAQANYKQAELDASHAAALCQRTGRVVKEITDALDRHNDDCSC